MEKDVEERADDWSLNRSNSSNDGDEDQSYCPIDPKSAIRLNEDIMKVKDARNGTGDSCAD